MNIGRLFALAGFATPWLALGFVTVGESAPTNGQPNSAAVQVRKNIPSMVEADGKLRLKFGDEFMALPRGLQPSLLRTASGAFVVQGQVPEKTFPTKRIVYFSAMETRVSRDDGRTWEKIPLKPGKNGLNMEGGAVLLRDGTVLALDTFITPGSRTGEGVGQIYISTNDWRSLDGPQDVVFDLPGVNFYGSKDDGGRPHEALRAHRRIIELPNGDLMTTLYGWLQGDNTPSTYAPSMKKTRVLFVRSTDRGRHWKMTGNVSVDPSIGTEGLCEPVLNRVNLTNNQERLLCLMRTGRELYEIASDDGGVTWTPPHPHVFAGLDIYRTELWVDMFRNFKGAKGKLLDENNPDELRGAVVDPDLIELRSGLLVASFGIRIPQKACWQHPEHPWNGNYLAFSQDHGKTWPNVVRLTSGVLTTHYTAIEETLTDNRILVLYDLGGWSKGMPRDIWGRFVEIAPKP